MVSKIFQSQIRGSNGFSSLDEEIEEMRKSTTRNEANIELVRSEAGTHVHDQISSSSSWLVDHGLDKFPSVTVVDSAGTVVIGEVRYLNKNAVLLSFNSEFSGTAYLN